MSYSHSNQQLYGMARYMYNIETFAFAKWATDNRMDNNIISRIYSRLNANFLRNKTMTYYYRHSSTIVLRFSFQPIQILMASQSFG